MERRSEFVSQVTSFPPLSPEESDSGVAVLFSKLFNFSRPVASEQTPEAAPATAAPNGNWKDEAPGEQKEPQDSEEYEGPRLQNVLRRISSLVALKSSVCNH